MRIIATFTEKKKLTCFPFSFSFIVFFFFFFFCFSVLNARLAAQSPPLSPFVLTLRTVKRKRNADRSFQNKLKMFRVLIPIYIFRHSGVKTTYKTSIVTNMIQKTGAFYSFILETSLFQKNSTFHFTH